MLRLKIVNEKNWVNNYNTVHNTNTMGSAVLILSVTMIMNSVNVSQKNYEKTSFPMNDSIKLKQDST